jgi:Domain of unknown function (DUF4266)
MTRRTFPGCCVIVIAAAAVALAGCTHVKPWERGKLAHPTMSGAMTVPGPAEEHVYSVHEGAVGGGASVESGCGCN